eukprot:TRINITY_DN1562_c0_g1_i1.p2 TRINITY_DN1562_c0_g1~~TRINITY_DN1562_c0_g1_i1.p2  ORF type:complete len:117 (-),score=1.08 TRINITY_DN1562_c0_g1_i1:658-1008(-)
MNSRRSFYKRREDSRDRDHRRGRYERRRERSRSRSRSRGTKRITNMSELKVSERSDLRELSSEIARRTKLSQPCSIAGIGISCVYNGENLFILFFLKVPISCKSFGLCSPQCVGKG